MGLMEIIAWPLGWVMWFFYNFLGKHYVLSLVLFTLVIRLILLPSSVKQQKNTARMALFQPKIQKIQKKYGKNQQKVQEETMKLYEEEGYNPMGGCFPMLLQLPILYGLFNVVYNPITHLLRIADNSYVKAAIDAVKAAFSTNSPQIELMKILNNPAVLDTMKFAEGTNKASLLSTIQAIPANLVDQIKSVNLNFFGLNLGERPEWWTWLMIIPILSGLSSLAVSLISQKLSRRNMGDQQANSGMMKVMMLIMPLMSFFIAFSVPGGVGLYWTISNVIAGIQSFVLYKIYTPARMEKIVARERELIRTGKKKAKKKGFMEKMQAAQQEALAQQNGTAKKPEHIETAKEKEINKQRLKEARKRMAEKYGDTYEDVE